MALIKSAQSSRLTKDAIVLDMTALDRQAERMLAAARAQADQILAEARAQALSLTEAADQRGYDAGLARGHAEGIKAGQAEGHQQAVAEGRAQIEQLVAGWTAALESWRNERERMQQEASEDVLRFAFTLAEKIIHRAISQDPAIVVDQVRAALATIGRPTDLVIHVHPSDREKVQELLPGVSEKMRGCAMQVVDDLQIEPGGCTVSQQGGTIDASIRTQLNRIAETLLPVPAELNIEERNTAEGGDRP